MITLSTFFDVTSNQYTETCRYQWSCFGQTAQCMDYSDLGDDRNPDNRIGFCISVTHDLQPPNTVFVLEVFDYTYNLAWIWINPAYLDAYKTEASSRGVDYSIAWDDVRFNEVDEVALVEIAKSLLVRAKIRNAEFTETPASTDGKEELQLDLNESEILQLALEAHRRNITLNQMVEVVLLDAIDRYKAKQPA